MDNLDNVTDLYNIIAILCQYIVRSNNKNYLVRYGCISTLEKKRVKQEIEFATPLKRGENGRFIRVKAHEITNVFVSQIDVFAQNLMLIEDYNCIMGLLQALDGTLSELLKLEVKHFGQLEDTPVLNTNRAATGIGLLPRCECVWARKSRMSYSYRRLDNYLKHFIVMEDRVLYEISDRHIFLPDHFFKGFDRNNRLKVAASPITAKASFEISRYENNNFKVFSIKYDEDKFEKDNLLIWHKITQAGQNGSEIIVFPEMLGNRETEDFIRSRLQSLTLSERDSIPAMIVLPSVYADEQNYCTILDRNGNILARQYKQNPYVMNTNEGEFMEDILGCNMINVFHYEGIGRFAILICKDFLTTRYMERIMRGFMLTMIIVPSFSTGAYDFKTSFDLCAHDYCNVVWINSCAAMIPGKEMNFEEIGYIRKRISRYDDEDKALYKMKPCKGLLEGSCDQSCIYYDSFGVV
ncbi:MAG: hypothetical protein U0K68_10450 [Agathobacter sp.]|nr:hypothetical protein [Agathobacter sp.]